MKRAATMDARSRWPGFTLVELMISTAIIALLVLILVSMVGETTNVWRYTTGKVEQFRETRNAFESITRRLSQGTLNTYWDYDDAQQPTKYVRQSELRFVCGSAATLLKESGAIERPTHAVLFHAPLGFVDYGTPKGKEYRGLENLLNTWGYYVEFRDDSAFRPSFLTSLPNVPPRYRYRLMEFRQPSENNLIYTFTSGLDTGGKLKAESYTDLTWFRDGASRPDAPVRMVAENIIALVLIPRLAKRDEQDHPKYNPAKPEFSILAPDYTYDSTARDPDPAINPRNQLPPIIHVTMVAIDEASAIRKDFTRQTGSDDPFALKDKFQRTADYQEDLSSGDASLEKTLAEQRINYRVFSTNVPIQAAKWSTAQPD
ncbi:MAG: Verru_Chthon cassette protein C [Pseudomonadota bacterium]|nr:Verru_Chthon cassette protein C [Pseudomonadota bacterium]